MNESYFGRHRKGKQGRSAVGKMAIFGINACFHDLHCSVHHKCDNKYALHYTNQAAFMLDNRQKFNDDLLFSDIPKHCLWVLPLREWVGYWQGNHRMQELLGMTDLAMKKSPNPTSKISMRE